eukprot:Pgem_evm2s14348
MLKRHTEQRIIKEMEQQYQEKLKKDLEKGLVELTVSRHIQHIQNELLTLKCPRFGHAFVDFDGCAALVCSTCSCHFCAYCLTEYNNSNECHTHVSKCDIKKRLTNDSKAFYATEGGIEVAQSFFKSQKTKEYWNTTVAHISETEIKSEIKTLLIKFLGADAHIKNHWDWLKQ